MTVICDMGPIHYLVLLMDDKTGQRESRKRGLRPIWMLSVLDDAAERGLVSDLPEKLEQLTQHTRFYVGRECRQAIEGMKQRDLRRKLNQKPTGQNG